MWPSMNHIGKDVDPTEVLVGSTAAISDLRGQIRRLAAFDSVRSPHVPTVLICGETGTGKGLVARTLHESGPRADGPMVEVNCAAIPETMLEAELFGFEEGAFTDARRAKPGLFEASEGGCLFLDEVDSCSLALQAKLLKAIEDKSIRRLGSVASHAVDSKLVAATQRNLADLVAAGQFRADLYHRLAVVVLDLPSLRERPDDIPALARHFLDVYAGAHGLDSKEITRDGEQWLRSHTWPGNVRELSHLMERITLLVEGGSIDASTCERLSVPVVTSGTSRQAPAETPPPTEPTQRSDSPELDEGEQIQDALRRSGGNVAAAARLLGIGRNALRYRMRRNRVDRPDIEETNGGDIPQRTTVALEPAPPETVAVPPEDPAGPVVAPSWEEKTVAILAIETVLPRAARDVSRSDPWTIIKRWHERIADHVRGFGGNLLHSSPSRLTAVFGVPRALEQSPQRAVQAGLAINRLATESREKGRPTPQIRMAAHLAAVHFDANAQDLGSGLLPIDDAIALPERLLGHAAEGEILVSGQIGRRVRGSCELVERTVDLGAERQPTQVFTVRGPKRPSKPQDDRGINAQFVGRERERAFLTDSFRRAAESSGQVTFIAGDAGIGKSRLIEEFRNSLSGDEHLWIEGRCASYGSNTAFLPIVDAARRYFAIDDRDDEKSARNKIETTIGELGADLLWTIPFVRGLLSMEAVDETLSDLDSGSRRSETFGAIKTILLRETERRPLILVIEDLHWIDEASEELLSFISESVPTTRMMLVCTYRPGYEHRFGDRSYHQRLTLSPLSDRETATMAGAALGVSAMPAELRELIASKAEGNPFFIEEITASLLEDGSLEQQDGNIKLNRRLDELVIPETIQDVLIARIDRLEDQSRLAIQIASVIGREFALRLLERITESGIQVRSQVDELRTLELIYEKAMHPELAYMFKHALTHDVAYQSVHQERRAQIHRLIGLAIEELYADRLAEHYETLAHHFDEGHDWKRALLYHTRAAEKATERHANQSVVHHCRKALSIATVTGEAIDDPTICGIEERLGLALFYLSDYAESGRAYERSAARAGEAHHRAMLLASSGLSYFWAHDYENAGRLLGATQQLATAEKDEAALSVFHYLQSTYEGIIEADMDSYERHCGIALELEQRSGSDVAAAIGCFARSEHYEWTAQYDKAVEVAERGILLGKKLRLSHLIIWPMWFGAKALCCLGRYGEAIARLQEAAEICDRIGDRAWSSRMLNTLGWCYSEIGADEIAAPINERAAAIARDFGDPEIIANSEINLALNNLASGNIGRAEALVAPIVADLASSTDPWMRWRFSLHVANAEARIAIARNDLDTALSLAGTQISGAAANRAPKIEARAMTLRGEVLLAMDRRDAARETLRESTALSQQIQYGRGHIAALLLTSETERRDGDDNASNEAMSRAHTVATRSAASLSDSKLSRLLLAPFE